MKALLNTMKKKIYKYKFNKKPSSISHNYRIIYGNFALKSVSNGLLNSRHIENLRRKLSKQFKKANNINKTKIFIKLTKWKPYTNKPMLSRMGKGAGPIAKWETFIEKGVTFIELSTTEKQNIVNIFLKRAIKNLPIKVILVKK